MIQTTVQVSGMACSMCEAHVNDAVRNALNILGVNPYWQGTAIGAVIVIAVLAEKLSKLKVKKSK